MSSADVVIVGSGVMGAATAYWLTRLQPSLRVTLVESDTRYEKASSSLSASSIRQQFTCPVNIRLSQFGIAFLREAEQHLGLPDHPVALGLQEPGYLYLAQPEQTAALHTAHQIQKQAGADVSLLGPDELRQCYPWLNVDDVALGSLGLSGEGWFDGPALHQAFLKKAMAQGVQCLHDRVVGLDHTASQVSAVRLASGGSLPCGQVVNAAGPWGGEVAAMAGVQLPHRGGAAHGVCAVLPRAVAAVPLADRPERLVAAARGPVFDQRRRAHTNRARPAAGARLGRMERRTMGVPGTPYSSAHSSAGGACLGGLLRDEHL